MIPIDPEAVTEYVCDCDREAPSDQRAVFLIRALTFREQQHIANKYGKLRTLADGSLEIQAKNLDKEREVLNFGLVGWRNFPAGAPDNEGFKMDGDGKRSELFSRNIAQASLDRLPSRVRRELMLEIEKRGDVPDSVAGK